MSNDDRMPRRGRSGAQRSGHHGNRPIGAGPSGNNENPSYGANQHFWQLPTNGGPQNAAGFVDVRNAPFVAADPFDARPVQNFPYPVTQGPPQQMVYPLYQPPVQYQLPMQLQQPAQHYPSVQQQPYQLLMPFHSQHGQSGHSNPPVQYQQPMQWQHPTPVQYQQAVQHQPPVQHYQPVQQDTQSQNNQQPTESTRRGTVDVHSTVQEESPEEFVTVAGESFNLRNWEKESLRNKLNEMLSRSSAQVDGLKTEFSRVEEKLNNALEKQESISTFLDRLNKDEIRWPQQNQNIGSAYFRTDEPVQSPPTDASMNEWNVANDEPMEDESVGESETSVDTSEDSEDDEESSIATSDVDTQSMVQLEIVSGVKTETQSVVTSVATPEATPEETPVVSRVPTPVSPQVAEQLVGENAVGLEIERSLDSSSVKQLERVPLYSGVVAREINSQRIGTQWSSPGTSTESPILWRETAVKQQEKKASATPKSNPEDSRSNKSRNVDSTLRGFGRNRAVVDEDDFTLVGNATSCPTNSPVGRPAPCSSSPNVRSEEREGAKSGEALPGVSTQATQRGLKRKSDSSSSSGENAPKVVEKPAVAIKKAKQTRQETKQQKAERNREENRLLEESIQENRALNQTRDTLTNSLLEYCANEVSARSSMQTRPPYPLGAHLRVRMQSSLRGLVFDKQGTNWMSKKTDVEDLLNERLLFHRQSSAENSQMNLLMCSALLNNLNEVIIQDVLNIRGMRDGGFPAIEQTYFEFAFNLDISEEPSYPARQDPAFAVYSLSTNELNQRLQQYVRIQEDRRSQDTLPERDHVCPLDWQLDNSWSRNKNNGTDENVRQTYWNSRLAFYNDPNNQLSVRRRELFVRCIYTLISFESEVLNFDAMYLEYGVVMFDNPENDDLDGEYFAIVFGFGAAELAFL